MKLFYYINSSKRKGDFSLIKRECLLRMFVGMLPLLLTLLLSCSSSDTLKKLILECIRKDRVLDKDDCLRIQQLILSEKDKYSDLFIEDKLDEAKYFQFIQQYIHADLKGYQDVRIECKSQVNTTVNIYIENSGSMDGYINGNTIYKSNLSDMIVESRGVFGIDYTKTFFVNSNVYESDSKDIQDFIKKINFKNEEYKQGNTSASELNSTLKLILSKSNDSNISILLSDFIYSLSKGQNTSDGLGLGKSLTKDAFLQHLNTYETSTLILKFNSDFKGKYYSYDNSITIYDGQRPYYVLILGSDEILRDFVRKIKLSELRGFENSYYISNSGGFNPYYEVFDSKLSIGSSRIDRASTLNNIVLNDVKLENGIFSYTIAADFSQVPDQKILTNISNYNIVGDFKISSITPRSDAFINESFSSGTVSKVKQSTATHVRHQTKLDT